jgi:hypothetical protein
MAGARGRKSGDGYQLLGRCFGLAVKSELVHVAIKHLPGSCRLDIHQARDLDSRLRRHHHVAVAFINMVFPLVFLRIRHPPFSPSAKSACALTLPSPAEPFFDTADH